MQKTLLILPNVRDNPPLVFGFDGIEALLAKLADPFFRRLVDRHETHVRKYGNADRE